MEINTYRGVEYRIAQYIDRGVNSRYWSVIYLPNFVRINNEKIAHVSDFVLGNNGIVMESWATDTVQTEKIALKQCKEIIDEVLSKINNQFK